VGSSSGSGGCFVCVSHKTHDVCNSCCGWFACIAREKTKETMKKTARIHAESDGWNDVH